MLKHLYHYTTIQNLALILKNRTLRLMPLNLMDDLQEAKSKDLQDFGQFIYVSSWTDKEEEVIPMWKMYTKPECGVRIGMVENPFQIFDSNINKFRDPTQGEYITSGDKKTKGIFPIIQMEEMALSDYIVVNPGFSQQLTQVKYSYDINELEPEILSFNQKDGSLSMLLGKLGYIKNKYWVFQQEWRYIIRTIPMSILRSVQDFDKEIFRFIKDITTGKAKQPLPYIDLHLSDYALNTMEIILAPDMPEANKILVECLIEKYNPNALNHIKPSLLTNLIR